MEQIKHYVLPDHTNKLYKEEAISSIGLTRTIAGKINELIDAYNELSRIDLEWKQTQEGTIRKGVLFMKDNLINSLNDLMDYLLESGYIDSRLREQTYTLSARLDNVLSGSLSSDVEIIDARIGDDGTTYKTIGTAIRTQLHHINPIMHLYIGLSVDTQTGEVAIKVNSEGKISYSEIKRKGANVKVAAVPNVAITYDVNSSRPIAVALNITDGVASLKAETINTYMPTQNDVVLFYVYLGEIIPVSITPQCLIVDGLPYAENPAIYKKTTSSIVGLNAGLRVDEENKVFTIENGYWVLPMYKTGVVVVPESSINYSHTGAVEYLVLNAKTLSIYMVDRFHRFLADEYCLGCLYQSRFIPVELSPDSLIRTNNDREVITTQHHITMNDMFKSLGNPMHKTKIVLAGDSITIGSGGTGFAQNGEVIISTDGKTHKRNPNGYCWANLFKSYIENNFNAEVINNGCSGTSSSWWNSHKGTLIPRDTDIVVLSIGTNDRIDTGATREETLLDYFNNLCSIVEYCHNNGIQIVLCSPIPSTAADENSNRIAHNFHMNAVVQRVAAQFNMEYANIYNEVFFTLMEQGKTIAEMLPDGLHPGDEMYRIMFYRYLKSFNLAPHYSEIE